MSSNGCTPEASEYLQTNCTFYPFLKRLWARPKLKALKTLHPGENPPKAELVSVVTVNPFVGNFFHPKKQEIFANEFARELESSNIFATSPFLSVCCILLSV